MAQRQRKGKGKDARTRGRSNTMFYAVLGVVALAGVVAIGYALMGGGAGSAATELVEIEVTDARGLYEQATPVRLGRPDAPVRIVEFGDFQCPACGSFSLQVRPFIVDRYVTSGQVQFVFYDFPLTSIHRHAVISARASRCAGEQDLAAPASLQNVPGDANAAYWVYHDKLFEEQNRWAYEQGSVVNDFVRYAGEVGLDESQFEQCLRSDRFADVVSANYRLAEQLRLTGTPTVIVNNRRVQNWAAQNLAQVVEEALGEAAAPSEDSGE